MNLLGVILAGGKSSRFGSDKAFAKVDGEPLISHVANALKMCDEVVIVGRTDDQDLDQLGLQYVPDLPGIPGPARGLVASLEFARKNGYSHVFMTSCDMWGLLADWPRLVGSSASPAAAVYDGMWQPMCSAWRSDLDLSNIGVEDRGPSLRGILDRLDAKKVTPPEGWENVLSINSPEDLQGVLELVANTLHHDNDDS